MKNLQFSRWIWVTTALLFAQHSFASIYNDELNDEQRKAIQKGEQVVFVEQVVKNDFPRVRVYQRVEATPEECMAVYVDYELRSKYFPDFKRSKITKRIDAVRTEVEYELDLPFPFSTEVFTVANVESISEDKQNYHSQSKLIKAESLKNIQDDAKFEPLGNGTLMVYTNHITLGRNVPDWFTDKAEGQIKATARAIEKQVLDERENEQTLLQKQISFLRQMFVHFRR